MVIEDIKEIREGNSRKLSVTVTNLGYDTVDEATVSLYNDGINGTLISSQALTSVAPDSTNELLFDISNSDFVAEDGSKTESLYFVSIDSEASESDYANNNDSVKLYPDCLVIRFDYIFIFGLIQYKFRFQKSKVRFSGLKIDPI